MGRRRPNFPVEAFGTRARDRNVMAVADVTKGGRSGA